MLGREYTKAQRDSNLLQKWEEWRGPQIWRNLCQLHGWEPRVATVRGVNWVQNGYDCGADIGYVLLQLMTMGIRLDLQGFCVLPTIPCAHPFRMALAEEVFGYAKQACLKFLKFVQEQRKDILTPLDAEYEATTRHLRQAFANNWERNASYSLRRVLSNLQYASKNCPACMKPDGALTRKKLLRLFPFLRGARSRSVQNDEGKNHLNETNEGDCNGANEEDEPVEEGIDGEEESMNFTEIDVKALSTKYFTFTPKAKLSDGWLG